MSADVNGKFTNAEEESGRLEFVIISLRSAVDRRAMVQEMMGRHPWRWRFFDASVDCDPRLNYDIDRAIVCRGYALSKQEVACFSSHWNCILEHSTSGSERSEYQVILEDDVILDPKFDFDKLVVLMQRLGIHYLKLYSRFISRAHYIGRVGSRGIFRFSVPPYGAQAYVISRVGAQALSRGISRIERPIDDELERYWSNGVPTYALFPYPVMEVTFRSTVLKGFDRVEQKSLWQWVVYYVFTSREKVTREWVNWRMRRTDRLLATLIRTEVRGEALSK